MSHSTSNLVRLVVTVRRVTSRGATTRVRLRVDSPRRHRRAAWWRPRPRILDVETVPPAPVPLAVGQHLGLTVPVGDLELLAAAPRRPGWRAPVVGLAIAQARP